MNSPRRFAALLFSTLTLAVLSCQSEIFDLSEGRSRIAGVFIGIGYNSFTSDVFLTLGVADSIQAQAFSGGWPRRTIYDSSIEPRRFTFRSSNPAVATVDATGHVATLSVGETRLTASVGEITSEAIRLSVSPPASALLVEPASVETRVGENFTVSVKALDAAGQSLHGVVFNVGLDTTWWALTSMPSEGTWKLHTPLTLHFQAKLPGRVKLITTVQNESPAARFEAVTPVVVAPQ